MLWLRFLLVFIFSFIGFSQNMEEKALQLFNQKKYEEAKTIFLILEKKEPNNPKIIEYLGDIAAHQKKWDDAIVKYIALTKKFPNKANYHYKLGGAMGLKAKSLNKIKALGMIESIKNAFEKAAQLDKNHIETRWALVYFYLELPAILGGSTKKALKSAEELITISPVDGFLAKGYIEEYHNNFEKAVIFYQKAHEIGNSETTYSKLYNILVHKIKDNKRANQIKKSK